MSALKPERTLVLIKPDGVLRGLAGEIIARFERAGLRIAAMKMVRATRDLILKHYPGDEAWLAGVGRVTLENLAKQKLSARAVVGTEDPVAIGRIVKGWNAKYLTAGPVIAIILEGIGAAATVRRLTGKTLPGQAEPGTIRGDYSIDDSAAAVAAGRSVRNLVHASGNAAEAEQEIALWFTDAEIHAYRRCDADIIGT
jgi:nucleoside-diphosphate kinase